jgi:hypothetical protein
VVAEVGLSPTQVAGRLEVAERLARHPAVEAVLDTGRVQSWTATKLLEHLDTLAGYVTPTQLAQAECATLAWLARTVPQLNARIRPPGVLSMERARRPPRWVVLRHDHPSSPTRQGPRLTPGGEPTRGVDLDPPPTDLDPPPF